MEWQIRNWLYFTWLCGDHIVEQHIHTLDKMPWAMKDEPPVKATASAAAGPHRPASSATSTTTSTRSTNGRTASARFCQTRQ